MDASEPRKIVVIGSSTGGPRTLEQVFARFPKVDAGVVVIQHMPGFINEAIRSRLCDITCMRVKIAGHGEAIEHGTIYIAPSDLHLKIRQNRLISLHHDEKVHFVRPSVDVAMQSLMPCAEDTLVGVILTGMGKDGAEGVAHIKRIGGTTIAQNLQTAVIHGMPKAAFETGMIDYVLPPESIRCKLIEIAGTCEE